MPISLPDETTKALVYSLQRYFLDERDEELGDLAATFLLEFILREIGPSVYNQAIRDAQAALHQTVNDLDLTLHEEEFGHSSGRA